MPEKLQRRLETPTNDPARATARLALLKAIHADYQLSEIEPILRRLARRVSGAAGEEFGALLDLVEDARRKIRERDEDVSEGVA